MILQAVRDEAVEEFRVPVLVVDDPADQLLQHRLIELRLDVAQVTAWARS